MVYSLRLTILLVGPILGLPVACAAPGSEMIRVVEGDSTDHLEVAWIRFAPPPGRPPVLLVNMVHVAEPGFFAEVQAVLDRAAVVLMEGIIREPAGASRARPRRVGGDLLDVADELRLVHQNHVLKFQPHWRKADMWETEFRELMAKAPPRESGPNLSEFQQAVREAIDDHRLRHPELAPAQSEEQVRRGAARRLYVDLTLARAGRSGTRPVAVRSRNRVALAALDRCDHGGTVALCWGFAHGPDFAGALLRRGYSVQETTWHAVFSFER